MRVLLSSGLDHSLISFLFILFYFYWLEANYFTTFPWVLSYIDMNQPWSYMYDFFLNSKETTSEMAVSKPLETGQVSRVFSHLSSLPNGRLGHRRHTPRPQPSVWRSSRESRVLHLSRSCQGEVAGGLWAHSLQALPRSLPESGKGGLGFLSLGRMGPRKIHQSNSLIYPTLSFPYCVHKSVPCLLLHCRHTNTFISTIFLGSI